MESTMTDSPAVSQSELLDAALRYCAVADWFESHPCRWHGEMSLGEAMDIFNRAEAELRAMGAKAMRRRGHRDLLLQVVGVPEEAR
ncbi:MAG: hypothetical protein GC159_13380 [Phycisphaera sp.]|nr:hypothetical protein [Phycisphaera sp.]